MPAIALAGTYPTLPSGATRRTRSLGDHRGGGPPVHGNVARIAGDPLEPRADRRKAGEVELALMGDMRVGIEGDVGDRVTLGGEEAVRLQVLLHDAERLVALLHPVLERMALQLASAFDHGEPEPRGAEVGLEAVLLEEHPLQRLGPVDAVLGRQRRAAGDVPENGVRFRKVAAGRDLEQRHVYVR